jgi:hypothetical protein
MARYLKGMAASNVLIPNDMERIYFIVEAETELVIELFAARNLG